MTGFLLRLMPWLILHIYYIRACITLQDTVYVTTGKSAVLECQVNPKSLFFWERLSIDLYIEGRVINPKLSNKVKLVGNITNGEYYMQINNVTEKDEGIYLCESRYCQIVRVTLIIQDPPTIRIIKNLTKRILRCEPNGIPPNYWFYRWQHFSEYGQLIRLLMDNQTIQIDQNSANIENFKLSGIYVCSATNGVADVNGSTVQTGKVSVLLRDKPRFVAATENIQYGRIGTEINICVSVYCYPEFRSVNILTSDFCCFNETKYQIVTDYNITVSSFDQSVRMKGYKISLQGFTLTETDFTTYNFSIENEIGDETFSVKLMSRDSLLKCQSGYEAGWLLMGCVVGGIIICSIASNIHCHLKRKTRVNVMLQTYPEEHYDEIGTINYNHEVFEPTTDVTQENNSMHIVTGDTSIPLGGQSERSEESSLEMLTRFSQSGDGYENPYHSINPENIEMHPYSSIMSNIYQNTIIFPVRAGTKNIRESIIAEETSKNPWLIIYIKSSNAESINRYKNMNQ